MIISLLIILKKNQYIINYLPMEPDRCCRYSVFKQYCIFPKFFDNFGRYTYNIYPFYKHRVVREDA